MVFGNAIVSEHHISYHEVNKKIPFADMQYTFHGKPMPKGQIKSTDIDTIGIMIADKNPAPFKLKILDIERESLNFELELFTECISK